METGIKRFLRLFQPWKWRQTPQQTEFELIVNNKSYDLKTKMDKVNSIHTEEAIFWWLNRYLEKPLTGSLLEIITLHDKFIDSMSSLSAEKQKEFVSLTLPNIDYGLKGYESKSAYVGKIMEEFDENGLCVYNRTHTLGDILSPYFTESYWQLYYDTFTFEDVLLQFLKIKHPDWDYDSLEKQMQKEE